MSKPEYKPSVGVQGGLYALGEFPIAHAKDIEVAGKLRLAECLPVCVTLEEYRALEAAGQINENTPYLIRKDEGG